MTLLVASMIATDEANRALQSKSIEKKLERRGEILNDMLERYETERNGIGGMRGTAWAAFNSVTEYADHNKIGRQIGTAVDRDSRRFESIIAGDADNIKQVALEKALAL